MRNKALNDLKEFTLAFPFLLIVTGVFLLAGCGAGVFSIDALNRYWPLAIVAAGLVELDPLKPEAR